MSDIASIVSALDPILDWVQPIVLASLFLRFIRSLFD